MPSTCFGANVTSPTILKIKVSVISEKKTLRLEILGNKLN